jgi:hypothetical protein
MKARFSATSDDKVLELVCAFVGLDDLANAVIAHRDNRVGDAEAPRQMRADPRLDPLDRRSQGWVSSMQAKAKSNIVSPRHSEE